MLTGGIDLSVGAVASMAGFVVATLVGGQGLAWPSLVALASRRSRASSTGIGVGVFRVHPLIMTLGMSLVVLGLANVWQLLMVQTGAGVPPSSAGIGSGTIVGGRCPTACSCSCRSPLLILLMLRRTGLRPAAVRDRRQPGRGAPVGRPRRGRS